MRALTPSLILFVPFTNHSSSSFSRRNHDDDDHDASFSKLLARVLEVGDDIGAFLRLLESGIGHLRAWNVLLGVLQVLEERVISGRRVGEG